MQLLFWAMFLYLADGGFHLFRLIFSQTRFCDGQGTKNLMQTTMLVRRSASLPAKYGKCARVGGEILLAGRQEIAQAHSC